MMLNYISKKLFNNKFLLQEEYYKKLKFLILKLFPIFIIINLLIILAIISPEFLSFTNFINIIRQTSLLFVLSAGMSLVILTGGIDLSMGSVLGLAGCIGATLIKSYGNLIGIMGAMMIGLLFGAINGSIIFYLKLPSFLVTYGTLQIVRGLAIAYMGGNVIWGFNQKFRFLGAGTFFTMPIPIITGLIIFLLFYLILYYTSFGRKVYIVGNNISAAIHSGINIGKTILSVYIIAGSIAAFCGLIYISRLNSAEAGLGAMFELDAIAAAVVGGISIKGGSGGIFGTVVGALIITLIKNVLNLLGISSLWQPFVIGISIVIAVLIDQLIPKKGGV